MSTWDLVYNASPFSKRGWKSITLTRFSSLPAYSLSWGDITFTDDAVKEVVISLNHHRFTTLDGYSGPLFKQKGALLIVPRDWTNFALWIRPLAHPGSICPPTELLEVLVDRGWISPLFAFPSTFPK